MEKDFSNYLNAGTEITELTRHPQEPWAVTLTAAEARELFNLIDTLSGGNATSVFAWDGTDCLMDEGTSACVKLFKTLGRPTPWTQKE